MSALYEVSFTMDYATIIVGIEHENDNETEIISAADTLIREDLGLTYSVTDRATDIRVEYQHTVEVSA
jgi:hypothetical protein